MAYDLRLGIQHGAGKAVARNIQARVRRETQESRADMNALRLGMVRRRLQVERRAECNNEWAAWEARLTRVAYLSERR